MTYLFYFQHIKRVNVHSMKYAGRDADVSKNIFKEHLLHIYLNGRLRSIVPSIKSAGVIELKAE